MTDRYEKIRKALAMGPTPGPWEALSNFVRTHFIQGEMGGFVVAECPANIGRRLEDAAHIAACDPDTIRALLEERDALKAENDRLHEQLRLVTVDQAIAEAEASDAHAENKRLQESLAALEQEADRG